MKYLFNFFANNKNPDSISSRLRRKRFELFINLAGKLESNKISILDVGGTYDFWEKIRLNNIDIEITLLNLHIVKTKYQNIKSVISDARNMSEFEDQFFDIFISNSVIEHVWRF